MTRRCSHCSNNGHNTRTCPTRTCGASVSSSGGVKLFGVRLTDGSIIKKSASMGNLSADFHSPSSAAGSPNPDSPLSDHMRDTSHVTDGYLSDDPAHGRCPSNRRSERKKGTPWTEEEHRRFLIGLKKLGKGDWRGISQNYVGSRSPTQVASHAQKYFIRQTNATRRKRRSSLFDMVPDAAIDPQPVPEDQELPSAEARETHNGDGKHSLYLSLKTDYEPMEIASEEVGKNFEGNGTCLSASRPTIPRPGEFVPFILGASGYPSYAPGFVPVYVPVPYPSWPQNTTILEEGKSAEASNHQVLKPIPIVPKEPLNVDELVCMSHLSLTDKERASKEATSLSLRSIGEPSRQSAFHANPTVGAGSDRSEGKGSLIQAV